MLLISSCMFGGTEWGATSSAPDTHKAELSLTVKTVDSADNSISSVKWFFIPLTIEPDTLLIEAKYFRFTMKDSCTTINLPKSGLSFRLYAVDTSASSAGMYISNQFYVNNGDTLIDLGTVILRQ